jgi:hypothetical protein
MAEINCRLQSALTSELSVQAAPGLIPPQFKARMESTALVQDPNLCFPIYLQNIMLNVQKSSGTARN